MALGGLPRGFAAALALTTDLTTGLAAALPPWPKPDAFAIADRAAE